LITPQGATILLTPELYEAVLRIVALESPFEYSQEEQLAFIRETRGKYRGEPSLTEALWKSGPPSADVNLPLVEIRY
jgi:hypothetical protein